MPNSSLFDSGRFGPLAQTQLAHDLWAFLNRPENLLRMEAASDLRRPAVEALSRGLLERFPKLAGYDRAKQFLGFLARQILEKHGFTLESQGVRIRSGGLFTRASRYNSPAKPLSFSLHP